jgi:hypothetical protein
MCARSAKGIRLQVLKNTAYSHMKGPLFWNQSHLHPGISLFMDTTILMEIAKGRAQVG